MKSYWKLVAPLLLSGFTMANEPQKEQHFMTTVELEIQEANRALQERARTLILDEFNRNFQTWPRLQKREYQIQNQNNRLIFSLISNEDLNGPMQEMVSTMIGHLNGRVRARGQSRFYKASLMQPLNGFNGYEVVLTPDKKMILSIRAEGVPLRDILNELQFQLGSFSFLLSGDCARRPVEWNFDQESETPKSVDEVMQQIATLLDLKYQKVSDSHIFIGNCRHLPSKVESAAEENVQNIRWFGMPSENSARIQQILFPVTNWEP